VVDELHIGEKKGRRKGERKMNLSPPLISFLSPCRHKRKKKKKGGDRILIREVSKGKGKRR